MNGQDDCNQAGEKHQETQLTIHLGDSEQRHPEREDRAEKVAELQRVVLGHTEAVLGPRRHVTPVVQLNTSQRRLMLMTDSL